jgi:hypothetical protein
MSTGGPFYVNQKWQLMYGFVKFQVYLEEVNISLNPYLETPGLKPKKMECFQFSVTCFSAIVDFISWFCFSSKT